MLNNIFSKEKLDIHNCDPLTVIVDYRERNSLVPAELIAQDFKLEFKQLKVADYIVKDVAIERKTESDFIGSIMNKRIWKQLEEIKQYENYLLIIEKDHNSKITINSPQIKGAILSIAINYKIPILFSTHPKETANYIYILAKKQKKETAINPGKKCRNKIEQSKFILESFQNIGPTKSKQLLEKFKSLNNIFNATEEELNSILGRKTKEFLRQLF